MNLPGARERPSDSEMTEVILVVEDEDEVRKVVCLTLELQGYFVLAAARPEQALELVRTLQHPIDLLLTDVVMPELSGPELAAASACTCPTYALCISAAILRMRWYPMASIPASYVSCPNHSRPPRWATKSAKY